MVLLREGAEVKSIMVFGVLVVCILLSVGLGQEGKVGSQDLFYSLKSGLVAQISLKVVEEDGTPLASFPVNAGFYGADKFYGLTDTNGFFCMEGKAGIAAEANWILQSDGFYRGAVTYRFKGGVTGPSLRTVRSSDQR